MIWFVMLIFDIRFDVDYGDILGICMNVWNLDMIFEVLIMVTPNL